MGAGSKRRRQQRRHVPHTRTGRLLRHHQALLDERRFIAELEAAEWDELTGEEPAGDEPN